MAPKNKKTEPAVAKTAMKARSKPKKMPEEDNEKTEKKRKRGPKDALPEVGEEEVKKNKAYWTSFKKENDRPADSGSGGVVDVEVPRPDDAGATSALQESAVSDQVVGESLTIPAELDQQEVTKDVPDGEPAAQKNSEATEPGISVDDID